MRGGAGEEQRRRRNNYYTEVISGIILNRRYRYRDVIFNLPIYPYTGIGIRYFGGIQGYSRVFRGVNKFTSRLRHLSSLYGYANGPASAIVNTAVVKGHVQEAAVNLVDEDEDGSDDE